MLLRDLFAVALLVVLLPSVLLLGSGTLEPRTSFGEQHGVDAVVVTPGFATSLRSFTLPHR